MESELTSSNECDVLIFVTNGHATINLLVFKEAGDFLLFWLRLAYMVQFFSYSCLFLKYEYKLLYVNRKWNSSCGGGHVGGSHLDFCARIS